MKKVYGIPLAAIAISIPVLLWSILGYFKAYFSTINSTTLSFALIIDLILIIPLFYFLIIRKTKIPKTTTIPILIIGLWVGYQIFPSAHIHWLDFIKSVFVPLIEFTLLGFIIWKIRKQRIRFQSNTYKNTHTYIQESIAELALPEGLKKFMVTEISLLYYALFAWKKRPLNSKEFSYHTQNGNLGLWLGLLLIIGIELFVLHHLMAPNFPVLAWVLTILSAYSILIIIGITKSVQYFPAMLNPQVLYLQYGLVHEAKIPYTTIKNISYSTKTIEVEDNITHFSPLGGLESHNIIIEFKEESTFSIIYGFTRKCKKLAFYIDDYDTFINQVQQKMDTTTNLE
jgi:hypothetical protein